jgi:hypothetical protein
LDAEGEARRFLKTVIDEGSRSEVIADMYISALLAERAFEDSWRFGSRWMEQNPEHVHIQGGMGVAAIGVGEFRRGIELLEAYTKLEVCQHCIESNLVPALRLLRSASVTADVELEFGRRLLLNGESVDYAQLLSVHNVFIAEKASQVPLKTYQEATRAWNSLASAPQWFLAKSLCGLAHRKSTGLHAFKFVQALSEKTTDELSEFIVDHLVELLPRLRQVKDQNQRFAADYAAAISLAKHRVDPEALAKAFRFNAPYLAKKDPALASEMLELYKEWRSAGILREPITPYSETIDVLAAEDPTKVLQSMQAETRDAVSLLLGAVRGGKSQPNTPSKEHQSTHAI